MLAAFSPVLAGWIAKVFVFPRPFWAHFFDPEMIFWYGGAALAGGRLPANVDQPGFPTHYLSAAFVKLCGTTPAPESVDRFRVMGYWAALALILLGAVLLARTCLREIPGPLAAAAVLGYFLAPTALQWTAVWTSESLYFPVACVVFTAAWSDFQRREEISAAIFGLSMGAALSLKFLFLTWVPGLLLAVFVVSAPGVVRLRRAAAAALGMLAGFVAMTCVAWSRYPYMVRWVLALGTHNGAYGRGGASVVGARAALAGLSSWAGSARLWFLWIAGFVVAAAVGFWKAAREERRDPIALGFVCFSVPAFLLGAWVGGRHSEMLRYLLPPALLSAIPVLVACRYTRFSRRGSLLILLVSLAILTKAEWLDVAVHRTWARDAREKEAKLQALVSREWKGDGRPVLLFGWRFPTPSFALRIFAETPDQLRAIEARFPNEGHYNQFRRQIFLPAGSKRWDFAVLGEEDLRAFPGILTSSPSPPGSLQDDKSTREGGPAGRGEVGGDRRGARAGTVGHIDEYTVLKETAR